MLTPQEIIESLDMTTNQRVNSARVEAPVFQELVGILALLEKDKVSEDDYKTNLDIPNLPSPIGDRGAGIKIRMSSRKILILPFRCWG